jgi:Tol biopolymer transport system component
MTRLAGMLARYLILSWALPASLAAQREPVLRQIKLPHSYYYREMYLPQVTSGPSSATWSPDGKSLIYSMQGGLWRQRIGDSIAEQLTSGPGYAYQPDWSPDGSRVVYAVYDNDAVSLRLLEVTTLVSSPLVADGAVNVEPRWSPDGRRVAYVSTAYQGRFHVWLVDVTDRRTGGQADADTSRPSARPPVRLTEDLDSKLPRYYYSRYDHYLSPSWSPTGKELILVSNRGKIWGTGGIWRMDAKPGAEMHLVHDEESTWRMRPDWSLDGKRVVYASYLGRQWHQLWLTTADGGDPVPLTFGDYDATNPRWGPDGRRIAYISNEDGNTALYVLEIPGGARTRIDARRRVYREPVGRLRISATDSATGKPLAARVSVTLADGRSVAPDDAWRHADDGFDRTERKFEVGYFHMAGTSTLTVPAGEVTVEATHGPEYRVYRERVRISPDQLSVRPIRLLRLVSLPGWTSGDLHVHMNYGGHYRATPGTLAFQARAEGLSVVENLIVNKEDRIPDVGYFTGKPDPVSAPDLLILHDQEFHTSYWGHTGTLDLTDHLLLPDYAGYAGTPVQSLFPDNATVADLAHRQHGLFGYVHPFDSDPDPSDTTTPLTNGLPIDVALGKVDYFEVVGFSDHLATSKVWYRLLNCGFRLPAGAGTDAMTNFASLRGPLGTDRVYVQSGVPLDRARWYSALKAGKSFATNGPLLQLSIGEVGIGGELTLPAGRHRLTAKLTLRSMVPIDHLELIGNGVVMARIPLQGDRTSADTALSLEVARSGWYVLRAYSDRAVEPVLDIYPFASTSPIYVTVGGKPVRSAADADYFLRWIDRLEVAASAHPGWNASQEKREVLERIREARAEFERRRS